MPRQKVDKKVEKVRGLHDLLGNNLRGEPFPKSSAFTEIISRTPPDLSLRIY